MPLPASLAKRVLLAELEIACNRRLDAVAVADRFFLVGDERVDFLRRVGRFQARARVQEKGADVETRLAFRGGDVVGQALHLARRAGRHSQVDVAAVCDVEQSMVSAGSATVGRACEDLGRRFIGAERVPKYHAIGMQRLAQRGLFGVAS